MPPIAKKTVVQDCMKLLNQLAQDSGDATWRAALQYGAWHLGETYKCPLTGKVQSQTGKSKSSQGTQTKQSKPTKSSQKVSQSESGKSTKPATQSQRKSTGTRTRAKR